MAEDLVKTLMFNSSDKYLDFYTYKRKLLALGGIKSGFDDALLLSLPITNSLSSTYESNKKKRKLAWSHLFLTLNGAPVTLVESVRRLPMIRQ